MDDQKCEEFQTRVVCKKSAKTNDSAFLPRNGYLSLLSVFHIMHDLPLHVALCSEAYSSPPTRNKRSAAACHFLPAILALFGKNFTWKCINFWGYRMLKRTCNSTTNTRTKYLLVVMHKTLCSIWLTFVQRENETVQNCPIVLKNSSSSYYS